MSIGRKKIINLALLAMAEMKLSFLWKRAIITFYKFYSITSFFNGSQMILMLRNDTSRWLRLIKYFTRRLKASLWKKSKSLWISPGFSDFHSFSFLLGNVAADSEFKFFFFVTEVTPVAPVIRIYSEFIINFS